MTKEVPPRIHAILARGRSCATVFRRGPSNQVAVNGCMAESMNIVAISRLMANTCSILQPNMGV